MSIDAVRRKSQQLQDNARRRIAAFYAMGAANAGIPLVLMWFLPELRLGLGYLVLTAVFLVSYVRRRSGFRTVSPSMTPAQGSRSTAICSGASVTSDATARDGLRLVLR